MWICTGGERVVTVQLDRRIREHLRASTASGDLFIAAEALMYGRKVRVLGPSVGAGVLTQGA